MKEMKTTVKGMVKRGLVLCMVGVLALGMVACGGAKDKKSTSTQPKTKTGSGMSIGKKSGIQNQGNTVQDQKDMKKGNQTSEITSGQKSGLNKESEKTEQNSITENKTN